MNLDKFGFLVEAIRRNRLLRKKIAQWSHPMFNVIYLPRPNSVPTADFQREIFSFTEDKCIELCVLAGFRESAKTSICTISFPIWSILSGQSHYIIIASQTQTQARQHLGNIRKQLEGNALLRNDFGPLEYESDEWGARAITSKKYDAKIVAVSTEEAIRGALYKHYRPDLIICDDIENLESTKTQEQRDKIYQWFVSEIIPLGSKNTRIFVLGNFLHEYSLVGRLMEQIESGERDGVCRRYPLIKDGICLWPGMYPDEKAIEARKRKIGDEQTWEREFLLHLISSSDKLVLLDWIKRYDFLPEKPELKNYVRGYQYTWLAVDLAISKNEGSDFTAIIAASVYREDERLKIYILPDMINRHVDFPEAVELMKNLLAVYDESSTKLFIESNGFQAGYYQQMMQQGYNRVVGVRSNGDKRTRLSLITKFIKDGTIMFPKSGADQLITQLIGFGREHKDDLVDSLTMLVAQIIAEHEEGRSLRSYIRVMGEIAETSGGGWSDSPGGGKSMDGLLEKSSYIGGREEKGVLGQNWYRNTNSRGPDLGGILGKSSYLQ